MRMWEPPQVFEAITSGVSESQKWSYPAGARRSVS